MGTRGAGTRQRTTDGRRRTHVDDDEDGDEDEDGARGARAQTARGMDASSDGRARRR
jgi:hypothetical protein